MELKSWKCSTSGMASEREEHLVAPSPVNIVFLAYFYCFTAPFYEGKELRRMFNEYHLSELRKHLGGDLDDINIWINYLSCCLKMHILCVRSKLPEDYSYEGTIQEYKEAFEDVHQLYGVSETLKVHILSGVYNYFGI